jgi:hypothetical protein
VLAHASFDELARLVAIRRAWLLFERSAELARAQRR